MEAKDYLAYIVNEIHTTIVATVDDEGLPVTAAIDVMDSDDHSLLHRAGALPALWQLYEGLSGRSGTEEVRQNG